MRAFLESVGFNGWILPALLIIPVIGAGVILALTTRSGEPERAEAANRTARVVALWFFIIEFIVSAGLWWSFDPGIPDWQAVTDVAWIPTWGIGSSSGSTASR